VLAGVGVVASVDAADAADLGLIREAEYTARFASEVQPLWSQRVKRGHFVGVGGIQLAYAAVDVPDERAAVVIVTGRTENILKYQEVVADLVRQGYSAYVYDHRGQGFSDRLLPDEPGEREKGHVRRFDDYVDDLQTFVDKVVRKTPNRRLLLLAHSMGGGVATRHLERFPGTFVAAALSSPMHQPNARILVSADSSCGWFRFTGWAFSESWAGFTPKPYSHGPYDEKTNIYTHSPVRWAQVLQVENEHRKVRLGGPTRGWVDEACSASARMIDQAGKIKTPVLVLQAGDDEAVTPEGQDQFCAALAQGGGAQCETGKPVRLEGARHELLIESDAHRVPAMTAILGFFDRQR
jgi:lysophospholipase